MTKFMTTNFRGTEVLGVEYDGIVFVVLKPLAEAMGLAWNGQLERIKRNEVLREGMRMVRIPSLRGGDQETVTLRLDRLHGWLFTVNTGHVRTEIRELVKTFQRECYEVLYQHFCGDRDRIIRDANESLSRGLRLVQECRQTHGIKAAAQLWEVVGLPMVPAMDDPVGQGSLFDVIELKKAA